MQTTHLAVEKPGLKSAFGVPAAATPPAPVQGWKLVPVEPTNEMIAALGFGGDVDMAIGHAAISKGIEDAYTAMLAAAPQPAQQQEPVSFITPLMEQQMFDDWCPYKGNPDPRVVWAAAVDAVNGLLLASAPQPAQQQEPITLPSYADLVSAIQRAAEVAGPKLLKDFFNGYKEAQPAQQEPCGWQFFQDGKWHNGMETNNHRVNTEAAGVPVRDVYPSPQPPAPVQQETVAWMHEWEDGEKIPMLKGRDDRNQDEPKTVRPLVYGDTSPQPAPTITPEHLLALAQTASLELDKVIKAFQMAAPVQQEPTKAMIDAAERIDWSDSDVRGNIVNMWQAMCAVAPQPAPVQGWKLVPVEPTNEMIAALGFGGDVDMAIGHAAISKGIEDAYTAMLAATPQPAQQDGALTNEGTKAPAQQEPVACIECGSPIGALHLATGDNNCPFGRRVQHTDCAPQLAQQECWAWPCVIAEADFEHDTITLEMQCSDYKVGAGQHWLSTAPPAQRKPLTPAEVHGMAEAHGIDGDARHWYVVGLVDAQAKHNIKDTP